MKLALKKKIKKRPHTLVMPTKYHQNTSLAGTMLSSSEHRDNPQKTDVAQAAVKLFPSDKSRFTNVET